MRGARIALLATGALAASSPAAAAPSLSLTRASKATSHIRHREAHNDFGLRARMHGAFQLGHVYCERLTVSRVICHYQATGRVLDDAGMVMSCTVDVRVRRARSVMWKRSLAACAPRLP